MPTPNLKNPNHHPTSNPITKTLLLESLHDLTTLQRNDRAWHMPIVAAIAISFPVFCGAYFGKLSNGLLAALGAMVILNLPYVGSLFYRMVVVLTCSFAMLSCFAFGLIAQIVPALILPMVAFMVFWVALFARYFALPAPAGVFILVAGLVALFMPVDWSAVPTFVGTLALGSLFAGVCACVYSLVLLFIQKEITPRTLAGKNSDSLIDSMIMSVVVTLSLAAALLMHLPRPYWVPVSCYVVIQGMTFSSVWIKQLHRLIGTVLGLGVVWLLMSLHLNDWGVAATIFCLVVTTETLITRHYAAAVMTLTPLTLLMVEYGATNNLPLQTLIAARFIDNVLGCIFAVIGILIMLSPKLRRHLRQVQYWLIRHFHRLTVDMVFVEKK